MDWWELHNHWSQDKESFTYFDGTDTPFLECLSYVMDNCWFCTQLEFSHPELQYPNFQTEEWLLPIVCSLGVLSVEDTCSSLAMRQVKVDQSSSPSRPRHPSTVAQEQTASCNRFTPAAIASRLSFVSWTQIPGNFWFLPVLNIIYQLFLQFCEYPASFPNKTKGKKSVFY